MKRLCISICSMIISIGATFSQPSIIQGTVKDSRTGEELLGATIYLMEHETIGTMSNYDGTYALDVQPGTYTVVCSYITYEDQIQANVVVEAGKTVHVDFLLSIAAVDIGNVVVMARLNKEEEAVSLLEQKNATVMESSIGAQELSRKGASDVAAGVKKIAGISMIGSSQLFVRGLGDRYNQALLNGMAIPSPNPSRKVIQLDLFPSDVVKSIGVNKVLSAYNYADYSGALINIETKDYPDSAFISIGTSIGYNNQTTFYDFGQGSSPTHNFFGFDVQERNKLLPDEYKTVNRNQNTKTLGKDAFLSDFGDVWFSAKPAMSFDVTGGNAYQTSYGKIGVLFSSSFENNYLFEDHVYDAQLKADGTIKNRFFKDTYTYSTRFTNLVTISHTSLKGSVIKANAFYTSSTDDMLELKYDGWDNEGDSLFVRNAIFTNNRLQYYQILGKKTFTSMFDIEWKLGSAFANSSIPDRRQTTYVKNNGVWKIFTLNLQESSRFFTQQNENVYSGNVRTNFKLDNVKTAISIGLQGTYKQKQYDSYAFYYDLSEVNNIITDPYKPLDIFSKEHFENGNIFLKNGNSYTIFYNGSQLISGGFTDFIYTGIKKTTIHAGLRYEYSNMIVSGNNQAGISQETPLESHDLFPAINIKYELNEKSNLRGAISRTVTRPSFFERSPASVIPKFGEPKTEGNKDLENGYNTNLDFKYELFPKRGEVIALGIYGKQLHNPIEMITKQTAGTIMYTYKNTQTGYAAGVEFEYKKIFLEQYFIGTNASYIYTHIEVPENANETEKQRTMQGASPYLINADVGYQISYGDSDQHISSIAWVYNVYGKRLYAVGSNGMGSVFEMPFHTLDLVLKNKISHNWNMNVSVRNILNQIQVFQQGVAYNKSTQTYERFETLKQYEKGISVNLSVSYKIN